MPAGDDQLSGWDEWEKKLEVMLKDVPRVAARRAISAMQGVIRKQLIARTKSAPIPPRIKAVAAAAVGSVINKRKGETEASARVGYGVGRAAKLVRIAHGSKTIEDYAGKRTVYTRHAIVKSKRRDMTKANTILRALSFKARGLRLKNGKLVRSGRASSKLLGLISQRTAKRLAKAITKKKTVITKVKMRGVGISKRNIHWVVFGTGPRRIKSFFGRGFAKTVKPFRPYLLGLVGQVMAGHAEEAYSLAAQRMAKCFADAAAGKRLNK
jgi:hypothetical protein